MYNIYIWVIYTCRIPTIFSFNSGSFLRHEKSDGFPHGFLVVVALGSFPCAQEKGQESHQRCQVNFRRIHLLDGLVDEYV